MCIGTLNTMLQYVARLPNRNSRLIKWRQCRETVDSVSNSFLKQSAAIDQRSQVGRILRAWRQLHWNHAGPERFDETRGCFLAGERIFRLVLRPVAHDVRYIHDDSMRCSSESGSRSFRPALVHAVGPRYACVVTGPIAASANAQAGDGSRQLGGPPTRHRSDRPDNAYFSSAITSSISALGDLQEHGEK
jgi:hypothetical protein